MISNKFPFYNDDPEPYPDDLDDDDEDLDDSDIEDIPPDDVVFPFPIPFPFTDERLT